MNNSRQSYQVLAFVLFLFSGQINAQIKEDTTLLNSSGTFPKKSPKALDNISISGYYRFIGNYSNMKMPYPEFEEVRKKVFIGDDSQLPQLLINISGRPSTRTSFGTDLYLWTPLTGNTSDYVKNLNLGVNLYGSHATKYGNFNVKAGGIHWYNLSPLTFGTNTGYNRYSLFERNPWDPNTSNVEERYNRFYQFGALTQDERWGQQAFQGIILDGDKLPKQFSFALMYGKTQYNGGFVPIPNTSTGGKIKKSFGTDFISLNSFISKTYTDSLAKTPVQYEIHTSEFYFTRFGFTLKGEIGTGRYSSPNPSPGWGEAINVKFGIPKKVSFLPIELHYYRISPKVINNNGIFGNTSIVEYTPTVAGTDVPGSQTVLIPFASSIQQIGQMTNNRQGFNLNTDFEVKDLKLSLGYGISKEIDGLSDKIAYSHPANNLALSRFWRWGFPSNVGPYGHLNKVFRGVYEIVQTDTIIAKAFNNIELNAKFKTKFIGRELYIFYLGSFSSVQSDWSAAPKFSKAAYIQTYYNQLEFYYKIHSKLIWTNYFGYDRIICNEHTILDDVSLKPKNQTGFSFATGFDYYLSKNAGLYLRQRWMNYNDANFSLDKYKGFETTLELKIYF